MIPTQLSTEAADPFLAKTAAGDSPSVRDNIDPTDEPPADAFGDLPGYLAVGYVYGIAHTSGLLMSTYHLPSYSCYFLEILRAKIPLKGSQLVYNLANAHLL